MYPDSFLYVPPYWWIYRLPPTRSYAKVGKYVESWRAQLSFDNGVDMVPSESCCQIWVLLYDNFSIKLIWVFIWRKFSYYSYRRLYDYDRSKIITSNTTQLIWWGRIHDWWRLPIDMAAPGLAQYRRRCIGPIDITIMCSLIRSNCFLKLNYLSYFH